MIIEVRNATGFVSEQMVNIVNRSLNVEGRGKEHISKITAYKIKVRYQLVDAEKRLMRIRISCFILHYCLFSLYISLV